MAAVDDDRKHLSIVVCGHVDAGKSTTTGRLLFELGGVSERDLEKLRLDAAARGLRECLSPGC